MSLDQLHARVKRNRLLKVFTVFTRILLALAFLPSGLTKVLGNRFTVLGIDDPVGFFFEALYRTGFYWRFLGICQLTVALLLVIPRTSTLGALAYFPLILNIFVITVSMGFRGTPVIT
ncbi:MAG TPA: DoxX family membrane protein, partial [Pyrinomonadaceae bacterium]|nr:DoxX family membrane protein [Pyrinomonadaceae bacterium]